MEVERKYLLSARPDGLDAHESGRLEQGYLALDPAGAEVRVRRKGAKHTLTVKTGAGLARGEEEIDARGRGLRPPVAADRGPAGGQDALPACRSTAG